MNFLQIILLNSDNKIDNFLVGNAEYTSETLTGSIGPIKVDYHPFAVKALWDKRYAKEFEMSFNHDFIDVRLRIVEEKDKKPFFSNMTKGHSLLFFSELIFNLANTFSALGFTAEKIVPDIEKESLMLRIKVIKNIKKSELFSQFLIFGVLFESLLCARGLLLEQASIFYGEEVTDFSLFLERALNLE